MIKVTFIKLKGSPKNNISTKTVPTAPIPTNTAYTVPTGKNLQEEITRKKLIMIIIMVPVQLNKESAVFNPVTHNISISPASITLNHCMDVPPFFTKRYYSLKY